tara:strand:+ start:1343 stop:1768 length:426 start_codon:yes stop_codon:yes gene_type:complete
MRYINKIIVHCSATPECREVSVDTIRSWHLDRGWSDIGYHYIIQLNGDINKGRDILIQGAHVRGQNKDSIGICYIGGMDSQMVNPKDTRTTQQTDALLSLLKELKCEHPDAIIYGHRDFSTKACPSFDATEEYKEISNGKL